eukprot:snap_masked-scaffold_4-processed-gene-20.12-mRNA-1 protein AED:0.12 eAED:0.17 QI:0/-1/0/1/-1/1/1/0/273
MAKKYIVFDFGSVIRVKGPQRAPAVKELCDMFNAKLDELNFPENYNLEDFSHLPEGKFRVEPDIMKQFLRGRMWKDVSLGKCQRGEAFEDAFSAYGITDEKFKGKIVELYDFTGKHVMQEFKDLLKALNKRSDVELAILSNHGDTLPSWLRDKYGIVPALIKEENVFVSFQYGCKKPDPQFYQVLLDKLGIERGESGKVPESSMLFIDNKKKNCEAAEDFGLNSFHYVHDAENEVASVEQMSKVCFEFLGAEPEKQKKRTRNVFQTLRSKFWS